MAIEKIREGLYIKKSFDGYRVVYPILNDDYPILNDDRSINWKNLIRSINWKNLILGGGGWKFIKVMLIVALILFVTWSYNRDNKILIETINYAIMNPCEWCTRITQSQLTDNEFYNFTIPNLSELFIKEEE